MKILQKCLVGTLLMLLISATCSKLKAATSQTDSIKVYVFLHESCRISQYYTPALKQLHEKYASDHLHFVGLFPNFSSKPPKMEAFKQKYALPFVMKTDYYHTQKEKLGASVTPELVVFDESNNQIRYRGRIDDSYVRVGRRKQVTTTSELRDVLQAIVTEQPITVENTTAIGCFIGKSSL
ncbi:MAG: hypothetical protein AAGJ18_28850 [Bacteroidota bacterium]